MPFWMREPKLEAGEKVLRSLNANRTQGWRAVGGRLFITNDRLRFVANRLEHRTGGRDWTVGRDAVEAIAVADRSLQGGLFAGGIRRRLKVEAESETTQFVVNGVDEVVEFLRRWAHQAS